MRLFGVPAPRYTPIQKDSPGYHRQKRLRDWWTWPGSNRRPLPCHGSALPAAPQAHCLRDTTTSCPLRTTTSILADRVKIVNAKELSAVARGPIYLMCRGSRAFNRRSTRRTTAESAEKNRIRFEPERLNSF